MPRIYTRKPLEERFWSHVNKTDSCWEWTGALQGGGYGTATGEGGRQRLAHRLGYELQNGPIPPGLYVLHHCDNRKCVRGDHLFAGTQQENLDDCVRKQRIATSTRTGPHTHPETRKRGESNGMAILTAEQVQEIRRRYVKRYGILTELGSEFNVSPSTIWTIVNGKHWRHLL